VLDADFEGVLEPDEVVELAGAAVVVAGVASVFGVDEESDFDESDFEDSDGEEPDLVPRLSFL
jgi:hypothetical protein